MGSQGGGGVSGDVDAWPAIPELPDSRAHEKSDCRNVPRVSAVLVDPRVPQALTGTLVSGARLRARVVPAADYMLMTRTRRTPHSSSGLVVPSPRRSCMTATPRSRRLGSLSRSAASKASPISAWLRSVQ